MAQGQDLCFLVGFPWPRGVAWGESYISTLAMLLGCIFAVLGKQKELAHCQLHIL